MNNTLINRITAYINGAIDDFNELALLTFAHQYHHCHPYQQYCRNLQLTPAQVTEWRQIPALSSASWQTMQLTTFPLTSATQAFYTSGTSTGMAARGKHYYQDLRLYDAAIRNSFLAGLNLNHEQQLTFRILAPDFAQQPTRSLSYMFTQIVSWYGNTHSRFYEHDGKINAPLLLADLQNDISKARPVVLLGTAFAWADFFDYMQAAGIRVTLPPGSKLLETGGLKSHTKYISRSALYNKFTHYLGLPYPACVSEYGMTELFSQCYARAGTHSFTAPSWLGIQVIDPHTGYEVAYGNSGVVKIFDLANYHSIAALLTADLAVKTTTGFRLLGRAPQAMLRGCSLHYA